MEFDFNTQEIIKSYENINEIKSNIQVLKHNLNIAKTTNLPRADLVGNAGIGRYRLDLIVSQKLFDNGALSKKIDKVNNSIDLEKIKLVSAYVSNTEKMKEFIKNLNYLKNKLFLVKKEYNEVSKIHNLYLDKFKQFNLINNDEFYKKKLQKQNLYFQKVYLQQKLDLVQNDLKYLPDGQKYINYFLKKKNIPLEKLVNENIKLKKRINFNTFFLNRKRLMIIEKGLKISRHIETNQDINLGLIARARYDQKDELDQLLGLSFSMPIFRGFKRNKVHKKYQYLIAQIEKQKLRLSEQEKFNVDSMNETYYRSLWSQLKLLNENINLLNKKHRQYKLKIDNKIVVNDQELGSFYQTYFDAYLKKINIASQLKLDNIMSRVKLALFKAAI